MLFILLHVVYFNLFYILALTVLHQLWVITQNQVSLLVLGDICLKEAPKLFLRRRPNAAVAPKSVAVSWKIVFCPKSEFYSPLRLLLRDDVVAQVPTLYF
jgi:hypothetical protein